MSIRALVVTLSALGALSGCSEEVPRPESDSANAEPSSDSEDSAPPDQHDSLAPTETPRSLTCSTDLRSVSDAPYFDESAPGSKSPEGAVEAWLESRSGRDLGPHYVLDQTGKHAWILRDDGTAEARVNVQLTEGGGYFYYGHEACG